jgi:Zn-dependent peptidase ImmA (M78 family)
LSARRAAPIDVKHECIAPRDESQAKLRVKLVTDAYIRHIAEDALVLVGVTEPPVPIEEVAASLCIPVRTVNLPAFFTAATIYEEGLPVMVVNSSRPPMVQRDALAHMIGHVLLLLADESEMFPRQNSDHSAADKVARELVTPTSLVIEQSHMWFNDFRYLARLFGVTESTMMDRMRDLHLIKSQGVMWDF